MGPDHTSKRFLDPDTSSYVLYYWKLSISAVTDILNAALHIQRNGDKAELHRYENMFLDVKSNSDNISKSTKSKVHT